MALVFYSILPALYVRFPETFRVGPVIHEMTMAYPGGTAELLIMQFAAFCFIVVAADCHFLSGNAAWPVHERTDPRWRPVFAVAVALTVLGIAIIVANRHIASVGDVLSAGIGREILHAQGPLLSFCLATLAYVATDRFRVIVLFVMAMLVLVGLTVSDLSRLPIFIVLSPLVLILAIVDVRWKEVAKFSGVAILVVVVSIVSVAPFRSNFHQFDLVILLQGAKNQVISKLIARQGISGWCFDRVARNHLNRDNRGNPFFFVTAVVPRAIWPDKPNLSRGSEYAEKYCGMAVSPDAPHSESLTLLGEPVINGGAVGIVVAQIFLGAGLLAATFLARRTGALGAISLAAMLPWLTQFEQHFALYFANAVKMFLFMTPIVVTWFILGRMTERWAR